MIGELFFGDQIFTIGLGSRGMAPLGVVVGINNKLSILYGDRLMSVIVNINPATESTSRIVAGSVNHGLRPDHHHFHRSCIQDLFLSRLCPWHKLLGCGVPRIRTFAHVGTTTDKPAGNRETGE